jgi:hypothetical protein
MGREVAVGGYARLPDHAAAQKLYEYVTLSTVVSVETHEVLQAGCTLVSDIARSWICERLVGVNLLKDPSPFVQAVERDFWSPSAMAIVQAYRDLVKRYRAGLEREGLL